MEMPSPTQLTGADHLALLLPSTDRADVGNQSSNGLSMPMRCIHRIRELKTDFLPNQTEPIRSVCLLEVW